MAENSTFTLTKKANQGQAMYQSGKIVFDATAITAADYIEIDVGFKPSYVNFTNITDRITVEHFEGMTDNTCVKSAAAGTRTLESANGGITLTDTGFRVSQNATLAVIAASKTCHYLAEA
jgi:hypothetical protein